MPTLEEDRTEAPGTSKQQVENGCAALRNCEVGLKGAEPALGGVAAIRVYDEDVMSEEPYCSS